MNRRIKFIVQFFATSTVDPEAARRARLLNILLGIFGVIILLGIGIIWAVPLKVWEGNLQAVRRLHSLAGIGLALIPGLYLLNRYVSGRLAQLLFVGLLILAAALTDEPEEVVHGQGVIMFVLPIFLSSLLVRSWVSFPVAGISTLVVTAMSFQTSQPWPNPLYLLIFFLLAAVAWLAASGLEQMVRQMHTTLAELRLGEARYRLLAENAADVIWELDTATMRFTYVSPSIVRLRGYTPAEALTQSLEQILTPPSLDMVNAELPKHIQAFLAGGPAAVPRMYEVEQRCKDGTTVWTEMTATLMRNAAGGVNVLGVSRDVSARHQAEEALRLSEQKFAKAFRASPDVLIISRQKDGLIIETNDSWERVHGYTREEVIGQTSLALGLFVDPTQRAQAIARLQEQGFLHDFEVDIRRKSGEVRQVSLSAEPLELDQGPCILTIVRDVTEHKRAARIQTTLYRISEAAQTTQDLMQLFGALHAITAELMPARNFYIALYDAATDLLSFPYYADEFDTAPAPMPPGKSVTGYVLRTGQPLLATAEVLEQLKLRGEIADLGTLSVDWLGVPLTGQTTLGVMAVQTYTDRVRLTPADQDLLMFVSTQVAMAIERKRGEVALREQRRLEEQISKIAQTAPGGLYSFQRRPDGTGFMPYVSPAWEALFDLRAQEVREAVGPIFARMHPDDVPYVQRTIVESAETMTDWIIEFRINHPQRGLIWVGGHSTPLSQPDGSILWHGFITDITARRQAEESLRQSEAMYRAVVESQTDLICRFRPDGTLTFVNAAYCRYHGEARDALLGSDFVARVAPEDRALARAHLDSFGAHKPVAGVEYREIAAGGKVRWLNWINRPIFDDAGHLLEFQSVGRDITERKQAEEALERRVTQLALLNDISAQLAVLQLDRVLERAAYLMQERFGYRHVGIFTLDSAQGALVMRARAGEYVDQFPPDHHLALGQGMVGWVGRYGETLLANDVTQEPRYVNLYPGRIPTLAELTVPIRAKDAVVGVLDVQSKQRDAFDADDVRVMETLAGEVAIAIENARLYEAAQQEIAERRQAEVALAEERAQLEQRIIERTADLRQANLDLIHAMRAKDEFLATMSHELRTPLNAILGKAETLQEGIFGPMNVNQLNSLHLIEESGRHLLALINDILDVAKIESEKLTLDFEPVSLSSVCEASLRIIKQTADQKHLTVSATLDAAIAARPVLADGRRLKQILINLLNNAVKFTPDGGQIGLEVRGDAAQETFSFIVWDTGIGIADADRGRLFQPFVQLDSSLARQYPGTGLGLVLVDRLAALHGGQVSMESVLGQGSRFTVTLPWQPAPPPPLPGN